MKSIDFYYSEFQKKLDDFNPLVALEFKELSGKVKPRELFLWLEKKRMEKQLPADAENLITEFYWDIC